MFKEAKSYRDLMNKLICNEKNEECCLNNCKRCPGFNAPGVGVTKDDEGNEIAGLVQQLRTEFEEEMIESVRYKQWINTECKFHCQH